MNLWNLMDLCYNKKDEKLMKELFVVKEKKEKKEKKNMKKVIWVIEYYSEYYSMIFQEGWALPLNVNEYVKRTRREARMLQKEFKKKNPGLRFRIVKYCPTWP